MIRLAGLFLASGALCCTPMRARADSTTALPTGAVATAEDRTASQPIDRGPPPAGALAIDAVVTLVSDYRYRGFSYTDNRPAIQGLLTVSHPSGAYVAAFVSNLGGDGSYGGDDVEADILAGYTRSVDTLVLDMGIWNYRFPGTRRTGFVELYGASTIPLGRAKAKLGFFYAPKQRAIGRHDNLSAYADLGLPVTDTPVTLRAHAGYTTGRGSTLAGPSGRYMDWSIGADVRWRAVTLNLSYVNTTIDRARADRHYAVGGRRVIAGAVIASIAKAF